MNPIKTVVAKGFVPIVNHNNDIYGVVESVVSSSGRDLLDGPTFGFIVSSQRANAYSVRTDHLNAVLVSDSLIQLCANHAVNLINAAPIRKIFSLRGDISYVPESVEAPVVIGDEPDKTWTKSVGKKTWYSLFYDVLCAAVRFVALHEIGHMHLGHIGEPWSKRPTVPDDTYEHITAALTLETYGGEGKNRFRRIDELAADRAAAFWHAQLFVGKFEQMLHPPDKMQDMLLLNAKYMAAFLGVLVAILSRSCLTSDAETSDYRSDHPSFDSRLEWVHEGVEMAFEQLLDRAAGGEVLHSITILRGGVEQVVQGKISDFVVDFQNTLEKLRDEFTGQERVSW
jgi:hypothetical protein